MKPIALFVVSLALAVTACNKEPAKTSEVPDGSAAAGGGGPGTVAVKDAIEVMSDGVAPKKVLRYAAPKGTHTPIEMLMDFDVDAGIKQSSPTLVITMDLNVDDVTSDGKMKVRTDIADVAARDRPGATSAAMLKGSLDLMTGTKMMMTLGPDGSVKDTVTELGPKTPPAMKDQLTSMNGNLERLALQLPKVPVGVGAKWKATKQVEQNGMNITTATTFEVTAIDGDKVSYTTTVSASGPEQTVTSGGITAKISNISGSGSGTGTIDLAKLTMACTLDVSFAASMAAGDDKTQLKTKMKLVVSPKS